MSVLSINIAKVAEDDRAVAYTYEAEFGADTDTCGLLLFDKATWECERLIGEGDGHTTLFAAVSAKLRRTAKQTGFYPDALQLVS